MICTGESGHGAAPLKNTAGEKVRYLLDKFMDFRSAELSKLANDPNLWFGDVTSVNLTMMEGGVQKNVVPSEIKMVFDIRLAVDVDHEAFENQVNTEFDLERKKDNILTFSFPRFIGGVRKLVVILKSIIFQKTLRPRLQKLTKVTLSGQPSKVLLMSCESPLIFRNHFQSIAFIYVETSK